MRIECALLADAAITREGLINVLGGGIAITTRETFPADLASVTLAIRLVFNVNEVRDRERVEVAVAVRHRNGELMHQSGAPWESAADVGWADEHQFGEIPFNVALALSGFEVPAAGDYDIALVVDNEDVIVLPLAVMHPEPV